MEGNVNYCDNSDRWVIVEPNGNIKKINKLVYGFTPYFKELDEVNGDGEYIKITVEIK